jgi:cation:H+ antiporter
MIEIVSSIFLFLCGLALLIFSSQWLIQACVKLSILLRLTPLFVGLIIVGFATSTPEAGVGTVAAIKNYEGIALGNIIGSNIANIGLILGLCAIFCPIPVNKNIFKRELPVMFLAVILLYVLSLDRVISRFDGALFIGCLIAFCVVAYRAAKRTFNEREIDSFEFNKFFKKTPHLFVVVVITLLSLGGIIGGADLMVRGGSTLAGLLGVSPWIIGITVFAIGTSLPELVASLTASFKKIPSISVGNIVGSNIFNIFFVLGLVALIRPIPVKPSYLRFEYVIMSIFSMLLLLVMKTQYKITRREGLLMFLGYSVFLFVLFK